MLNGSLINITTSSHHSIGVVHTIRSRNKHLNLIEECAHFQKVRSTVMHNQIYMISEIPCGAFRLKRRI